MLTTEDTMRILRDTKFHADFGTDYPAAASDHLARGCRGADIAAMAYDLGIQHTTNAFRARILALLDEVGPDGSQEDGWSQHAADRVRELLTAAPDPELVAVAPATPTANIPTPVLCDILRTASQTGWCDDAEGLARELLGLTFKDNPHAGRYTYCCPACNHMTYTEWETTSAARLAARFIPVDGSATSFSIKEISDALNSDDMEEDYPKERAALITALFDAGYTVLSAEPVVSL